MYTEFCMVHYSAVLVPLLHNSSARTYVCIGITFRSLLTLKEILKKHWCFTVQSLATAETRLIITLLMGSIEYLLTFHPYQLTDVYSGNTPYNSRA